MNKNNITYGIVGLILLLICSNCSNEEERIIEKFSEEKPYAIQIKKERSFYQAEKLSDRLFEMGIDAYIIQNADSIDDDGEWYHILCGNIDNLDSAKSIRKQIEIKYNLESINLEIATYSNFSNVEINLDSLKLSETKRINAKKPDVKQDVFDVLNKFPESNILYVQSASIINTPEDINNKKGFSHVYSMNMDLPRGVSKKLLMEKTTTFSEVIYKDNLYDDKVVIEIGKLRGNIQEYNSSSLINLNNKNSFEIAEEYADLILETGNYSFEEKKEIEINSYTKLYGYKVTIEPKRDYFRTYLILVDESNKYIMFSQSTDKTEEELINILSDIGKGNGLFNYDEFYNVFYTIPDKLVEDDKFIGFKINKLTWSYAKEKKYTKWSKLYVGHWSANGYFYNEKKGLWSYGLFDILTPSKRTYIDDIYANTTRTERVDVNGVKGHVVYIKKFNNKTWTYYKSVSEINFGIGRYAVMVDNTKKSWLNKKELIKRAEALQFEKIKPDDVSDEKPLI